MEYTLQSTWPAEPDHSFRDGSQLAHVRPDVAVAASTSCCPGWQTVSWVQFRFVVPGTGGFDSHSCAWQTVCAVQMVAVAAVPAAAIYSGSSQVWCAPHAVSWWLRDAWYCPSAQPTHRFSSSSRRNPAVHTGTVVVVVVAVVVVAVVVLDDAVDKVDDVVGLLELELVDDDLAVGVDLSLAVLPLVVLDVVGAVAVLAVVRDDNDGVEAVLVVVPVDADELLDVEMVVAVLAGDVVILLLAALAVVRDDAGVVACVLAVVGVDVQLLVGVVVLVEVDVVVVWQTVCAVQAVAVAALSTVAAHSVSSQGWHMPHVVGW